MRNKFGDKIYLCTKVANPEGGNLLIATTSNGGIYYRYDYR